MGLVLDTGGLMAFERGDREIAALVETARRRRDRVDTSSGCVAQSWRAGGARQALLARLLVGVHEHGLDPRVSRQVRELCAKAGSSDVVDAHIALLAHDDDVIATSDVDDLRGLLLAAGSKAELHGC